MSTIRTGAGNVSPDIFRLKFQQLMIDNLKLPTIVPLLSECGLLTKHEQEHLLNDLITSNLRIMKLTEYLGSKGHQCFDKFVNCLRKETKHAGHATLLMEMEKVLKNDSTRYSRRCSSHQQGIGNSRPATRRDMMPVSREKRSVDRPCPSTSFFLLYRELIQSLAQELATQNIAVVQEVQCTFEGGAGGYCETITTSFNDFTSLHSYLARSGVCNEVDIDFLISLMFRVGRGDLKECLWDYARRIMDDSLTELVNHYDIPTVPSQGHIFMEMYCSDLEMKVYHVWDLKELFYRMLGLSRDCFWFRGLQNLKAVCVLIWEFPSMYMQLIVTNLPQNKTELALYSVQFIQCCDSNGCRIPVPFADPVTLDQAMPFADPVTRGQAMPFANPVTLDQAMPFADPVTLDQAMPFADPVTRGQVMPFADPVTRGKGMPIADPVTQGAAMPIADPVNRGQAMPIADPVNRGQAMPIADPVDRGQAMPIADPVNRGQAMPIADPVNRGQAMPFADPVNRGQAMPIANPVDRGQAMPIADPVDRGQAMPIADPVNRGQAMPIADPVNRGQAMPFADPVNRGQAMPIANPVDRGQAMPIADPVDRGQAMPIADPVNRGQAMPIADPVTQGPVPFPDPSTRGQAMPFADPVTHGPVPIPDPSTHGHQVRGIVTTSGK